ncbi:hsp90 co-chaperone Cdc37-like 1 isoform X1 [Osmerus mordax]|uniref:hsp90 co-chaperone Cdc37-like 1 isoform X1 n=1 Tax=Osmerus mordax TaxID=8014 RepID=UPI0035100442
MEWFRDGDPMFSDPDGDPCSASGSLPNNFDTPPLNFQAQARAEGLSSSMASLCQSVKASVVSSWGLVEAQDQLCSLELHGSESTEQERARARASFAELSVTEMEWRRKESMLGGHDPSHSPVLGAHGSRDVFDKSIINVQSKNVDMEQDKSKTFVQKYEQELRHFGMLRRWDDSQRFLSDLPQLICEDTANYLILWCFGLQAEEKEALMEQVAHQAVAMQFILEMASSSQQDPRGCFRQFFHKAKAGQEGYLDVFLTELEAFKGRVREYTAKTKGGDDPTDGPTDAQHQAIATPHCRLDPKEVLESLPPELKAGFQMQDRQILQNVLSTMNPQVAEYHVKRCLEAGLWATTARGAKDDAAETDDLRMMETS